MVELIIGGMDKTQFIDAVDVLEKNIIPPLKEIGINTYEYAVKLYENAEYISLVENNDVVGLAAFYANDIISHVAYLSFISLADGYSGKGLGRKIIEACESLSREKGMRVLRFEVFKKNKPAIGFYEALEYSVYDENEFSFFMCKDL